MNSFKSVNCPYCKSTNFSSYSNKPYLFVGIFIGFCFVTFGLLKDFNNRFSSIIIGLISISFGYYYNPTWKKCNSCNRIFNRK